MKFLLSIIAFLQLTPAFCQIHQPGGVSGALIWEVTEITGAAEARWKSMTSYHADTGFLVRGKARRVNNYPALLFPGETDQVYNILNLGEMNAFTLFAVCQEPDTASERVIFSLGSDTAAELVITNRRLSSLDDYHYANYSSGVMTVPGIYSYTRNKNTGAGTSSYSLQFGRPPRQQNLPVADFNGIMPEVILFPRVISPVERQRVESYLAIKYGISLNQEFPVSYLNSAGEVIWDGELNTTHCHNIAALGRDDGSGLNQPASESTQVPGLMRVSAQAEMKNNSFLIWGDNGKALTFEEGHKVRRIGREWRFSTFNCVGAHVDIVFNELLFHDINPLLPGEAYWIMIDRSGTGKFPFRETDYFRSLPPVYPEKMIRFDSVAIDTDISGADLFTIIAAPSFFSRSIVVPPSCSSPGSGVVQCEIAGGKPPFNILLKGTTNNFARAFVSNYDRHHLFEGISQGEYQLQITDAAGKSFSEAIRVTNLNAWENNLARSYSLPEGEALILNAADGVSAVKFFYSWSLPDGSVLNSEEIKIDRSGTYLLTVTDSRNCSSITEINVRQTGVSGIRATEIFPNPVHGRFILRISLEQEMDINVLITDISGRLIRQTLLRNNRYYMYTDIIDEPGTYLITLVAGMHRETFKLIVQ